MAKSVTARNLTKKSLTVNSQMTEILQEKSKPKIILPKIIHGEVSQKQKHSGWKIS